MNTYTADDQWIPAVAMDSAGDFVVAWRSNGQDGSSTGIYAQRFSADGQPLGSEFRVNSYTFNSQSWVTIAMDSAGDFVIAWHSEGQDGSGFGVYAQRYNADGVPQGGEFRVNSYIFGTQYLPAAAMDAAGNFAIAWSDADRHAVYAQRFNAAGVAQGGEFLVANGGLPAVAMDATGNFVVSWTFNSGGGNGDIYAQRYDPNGQPLGGAFLVNSYTAGMQRASSVSMNQGGAFVITWLSDAQSGQFAQRFDSSGLPQGGEFQVIDGGVSGIEAVGEFVFAGYGTDGDGHGVFAQGYDALGMAVGNEFLVNTYTIGDQFQPNIGMNGAGDMVITWHSAGQDGSGFGVYAQRYVKAVPPTVQAVQINDNSAQRSRVTSLQVTFSAQISFAGAVANAFTLSRTGGGTVNFAASSTVVNGVTVVTLNNFIGPETEFGSLRDGRYTLTALASQISANGQPLDGNGDGVGGDDYTFGDSQGLFRYFGDINGDRHIDIADFGLFATSYGLHTGQTGFIAAFDFNNDGVIDIADFGQFAIRMFTVLP